VADLLLYGDIERSPALRHEIPVAITDPLLYAELGGRVFIAASSLERGRLTEARPDAELIDEAELGFHELLRSGMPRDEVWLELTSRAVKQIGVREAVVDFEFPLGLADRLRADGVLLTVDDQAVRLRRRKKSEEEMAGIRRAQTAAEAGMAAAAALLPGCRFRSTCGRATRPRRTGRT
jgi:Xaa-Pro aminopeptidase